MPVKVAVKNLGPIASAETVLHPLTVLVGANNTGKTFFATVLHRVVATAWGDGPTAGRRDSKAHRWGRERIPEEIRSILRPVFGGERDPSQMDLPIEETAPPGAHLVSWAEALLHDYLHEFGINLRANIEYAFGVQARELRRRTSSNKLTPGGYVEISSDTPHWRVVVYFGNETVTVAAPDATQWLVKILADLRAPEREQSAQRLTTFLFRYEDVPPPYLFGDWPTRSVHLPAGRTGIMQSYQVLASTLVRQSAAAGIRPIQVPSLPGTAADFLSLLLSYPSTDRKVISSRAIERTRKGRPSPTAIRRHVDNFETILNLRIEKRDGVSGSEVVAVTPEGSFPLARTSSMVSELAPILLTLRSGILPSDQIVLDEPEAHLHPALQRDIARFFAALVNAGVNLVLTTHSDFLVGELNNLIRTQALVDHSQSTLDLDSSHAIQSSIVSALTFAKGSRGGCVGTPMIVDEIEGIDESTFAEVMSELYDEAIQLSTALDSLRPGVD